MNSDNVVAIIVAALSSGFVMSVVQFIFNRVDARNGVAKDIKDLKSDFEEYKATLARTHILRFADDLHNGVKHSKEYFEQQIQDIKTYEDYCDNHKEFKNGLTEMASKFIKEEYAKEYFTRARKEEQNETA